MEGWIKLHRKFSDWEWFNKSEMVHLFIYLLLNANNEDGEWRGISIKRGQILTGLHSLNESTKISNQTIRTCLKRLEKTKEINIQSTNKYSIITVCNYDGYQSNQQATNKQANKQLTSNQQATNNKQEGKEEEEEKEDKSFAAKAATAKRKKEFYESLKPFLNLYTPDMIRAFFDHWSETNKSGLKMKFELQPTWETNLRLATWMRREKQTNNKKSIVQYSPENLFN